MKRDWSTFVSSIFFVLGFTLVFSLLGILLKTVLLTVAYTVQMWLARIGGLIIVFFGLYLLDLLRIPFLEQEHKFQIKRKFKSSHFASFLFGVAFAVGWSPCVGAVLGAVLTLAVAQPASAFFLLVAYSLGLGIPFLLVGLFTNEARHLIRKSGKILVYIKKFFGGVLVIMGLLVLFNKLGLIASHAFSSELLLTVDASLGMASLNIGIAFLAGLVSFLSPCILPLIPAYLSYLASIGHERKN